MRLGQLARKIKKTTAETGELISLEFNINLENNPNVKLLDEHTRFALEKFVLKKTEIPLAPKDNPEIDVIPNDVAEENPEISLVLDDSLPAEDTIDEDEISENSKNKIETIRAKTIKLKGFTVVDKIDLPEPPQKEMIEIDGVMYDKEELKKQRIAERKMREEKRRKELQRNYKSTTPKRKNQKKKGLSYAEKKRLEELQDLDKKEKKEKHLKRKRKKHYKENHLIKTKAKKKVIKKETVISEEEIITDTRPQPKSILGKLWRWLNTG